jgi:hypothetical protein
VGCVEVAEFLLNYGADPNIRDKDGYTPLLNLAGGSRESVEPPSCSPAAQTPAWLTTTAALRCFTLPRDSTSTCSTSSTAAPGQRRGGAEERRGRGGKAPQTRRRSKRQRRRGQHAPPPCCRVVPLRLGATPSSTRRRPKRQKQPRQDAGRPSELPREDAFLRGYSPQALGRSGGGFAAGGVSGISA